MVVKADDGAPDRPDFRAFRNWDGKTYDVDKTRSSLILAAGTCVRFWESVNFGGESSTDVCAPADRRLHWNLSRFDNRASSMKVFGGSASPSPGPQPQPDPAPPAGPPFQSARYVALGDSYSAGTGTRDYSYSRDCWRGPRAYPALVASTLGASLRFRACNGARTADVMRRQITALAKDTQLVTISIGGNDTGFSDVVIQCLKPWPTTCWGDVRNARTFAKEHLPGRLDTVYKAIRKASPSARVVVVGYPRIFSERDECNALGRISPGEQKRLNEASNDLADVIRKAAARRGFAFVDPRDPFDDHGVCASTEWLNGVARPKDNSYHPNAAGHQAYAQMVLAALGR
jgi:lysophospholipase L1-like esterase